MNGPLAALAADADVLAAGGLAAVGAALTAHALIRPRRRPTTAQRLTDANEWLNGVRRPRGPRVPPWRRAVNALQARKIDAGFRVPLRYLLLLFVAAGVGGMAVGHLIFGTPIFAVLGAAIGIYGFWAEIARRARELGVRKRAQIVGFVTDYASLVANGVGMREAFRDAALRCVDEPLVHHLIQAQARLDAGQGFGGSNFLEILDRLDGDLHDRLFHDFVSTVAPAYRRGDIPVDPLRGLAEAASEQEGFAREVRVDFAQNRMNALIGYLSPFVVSIPIHALEPQMMEQWYGSPPGVALGLASIAWCRFFYIRTMRRERRTVELVTR